MLGAQSLGNFRKSPGVDVGQFLGQIADPVGQQSQLLGSQVEHQTLERVF